MSTSALPIHFFTIVLNGEPFIRYHLERFKALNCPWHWHIIEGLAELKHDTAWSLQFGAQLPTDACKDGRSVDGTAEYLDQIAAENPENVTVYRAPNGRHWDGKLEMISAPVANLPDDCLLWEIDSDELWTTDQFTRMRELFLEQPQRTAAVFYCWYFVGPNLVINRRRRYDEIEWRRAWRYRKSMRWTAHEPPTLATPAPNAPGQWIDVTRLAPFTPIELEREQLVFQHYAYVTEEQLAFKEKYYGYKNIVAQWKALQATTQFPVRLKEFLNWPWVSERALVEPVFACGITPLATESGGRWTFLEGSREQAAGKDTLMRGIFMFVRPGGPGDPSLQVLQRTINYARALHLDLPIHIQPLAPNQPTINKRELFDASPFQETLFLDVDAFILDRLDFGFEMAAKYGMACCIGECPWIRRDHPGTGDLVNYNPGVLFFSKKAAPFFDHWANTEKATPLMRLDNPQYRHRVMTSADEITFSMAMAESPLMPFILPSNWNFSQRSQRTFWGPIKIWRDTIDPPPALVNFVKGQAQPDALIQYVGLGPPGK